MVIGLAGVAILSNPPAAMAAVPGTLASHRFAPHVAQAAQRFGIPERWIWAVMHQESGGHVRARSPVGAQGLMQIMPATWAMLTARFGLGRDPYDVQANIHAGAAYLRLMWDRYGDVRLMLAAYNAGPGRADAYLAGRGRLPSETVTYVARIAPSLGTSSIASRAAVPVAMAPSWHGSGIFAARKDVPPTDIHSAAVARSVRISDTKPAAIHGLFFQIAGSER